MWIAQLNNDTQRLESKENNYEQTLEKVQEEINQILLSRLSTQESLNSKLAQDLPSKPKEFDKHIILKNR